MTVNSPEMLRSLESGNRFFGTPPQMKNSTIQFSGKNNLLYCEPGVILENSKILFNGDRSIVVLGKNRFVYKVSVSVYSDNVCFFGRNNYINGTINIVLSERKHFFVGNGGLFSFGIWVRTADPHLIYSSKTMQRLNDSKSVYLGDHIWIGQSAMLLKGTQVDTGSVVGAMAVVSGKKIPHNTAWAGNPAKQIAQDIFWEESCVHNWSAEMTEVSQDFQKLMRRFPNKKTEDCLFAYAEKECIPFEDIEARLDRLPTDQKLDYLLSFLTNDTKNRFVHTK